MSTIDSVAMMNLTVELMARAKEAGWDIAGRWSGDFGDNSHFIIELWHTATVGPADASPEGAAPPPDAELGPGRTS